MIKLDILWFGVVENVFDPIQDGRVQVRIIGLHTENKSILPTSDLPWCEVMGGINSASVSGVGLTNVGMVEGSHVYLINKDSFLQEFIVLGTIQSFDSVFINNQTGFNDPNGVYPKTGYINSLNIRARGIVKGESSSLSNMVQNINNNLNSRIVDSQPSLNSSNSSTNQPVITDITWLKIALGELGVSEETNPDRIKQYLKNVGINASEETPWCSAFINWCLNQAGISGTRSALARSFLSYGNSTGLTNIPVGAIAVFRSSRGPNSGHVTFVIRDIDANSLEIIGGNQNTNGSSGIVSRQIRNKANLIDTRFPIVTTTFNGNA